MVEPRTRVSRGFAFVTMDSLEDANRCIKYLNQSVLEGRYITVERVMCSFLFEVTMFRLVIVLLTCYRFSGYYSDLLAVSYVGSNQR